MRRLATAALVVAALAAPAHAGPWTRDQGHFYVATNYSRIAASSFFGPDFRTVPIRPYEQHLVGLYAEVGLWSRWLTVSLDGTLYRRARIEAQGYTDGIGDWRVGLWSGVVTRPVWLALATIVGVPLGNPSISAGASAGSDAQQIARALPTGDGEWDVEWRASLGYSFGRARRWPLEHYLVVEAGYWLRTSGFADAFTYRLELGVRFPWRFVERFWLIGRLTGVESFASAREASMSATGLGNGVTYTSPGLELYGRVWRGLGASVGLDSAFRARSVAAGAQLKVGLSYQW